MWRGKKSWRWLGVMIAHLPAESEYVTALRESLTEEEREEARKRAAESVQRHGSWSQLEMLVARVGDSAELATWLASDGKSPRPKPLPRPGVDDLASVTPINARARAVLDYVREHQGAMPPPEWEPTAN